jgi:O-antigen ligase
MLLSLTRYSLYLLLIFTPLALASVQGWAISVIHFVTLIALTAFLFEKSLTWDWEWIKTPLDKPILCLLVLCLLSSVFSVHTYTSIWSSVLLLNYCIIYYLTLHMVRTRSQFRQLVYLVVAMAGLLGVIGLLKIFFGNPFPWWNYTDFQIEPNRLSSTFGNANHFAGYLEMTLPLLLGLILTGLTGMKRFFMACIAVLLFLSLMLSLSRGGWIGAMAGLLFMAVVLLTEHRFKKRKVLVALAGGLCVMAFAVLTSTATVERILALEKTEGLQARMMVWEGTVEMIKDHPVLGTGPGTFATVYTQYHPPGFYRRYFAAHNDYLHLTAETGLPLIPVMIWMIIALYKNGFKKLNHPSRQVQGITLGAMAGITAILVHSISDFNLHIPANAILFTVLAALVASPTPDYGLQDKEVRGQRAGN